MGAVAEVFLIGIAVYIALPGREPHRGEADAAAEKGSQSVRVYDDIFQYRIYGVSSHGCALWTEGGILRSDYQYHI